jgi:hypothetical protein
VDTDTFIRFMRERLLGEAPAEVTNNTRPIAIKAWIRKLEKLPPDVYIDIEN